MSDIGDSTNSTSLPSDAPLSKEGKRIGLIVVGMHRSGTSALARVLNLLGASLPRNLMAPVADNNETGFWEPLRLRAVHDQMLLEGNSRWDDWRGFDPETLGPQRLAFYKDAIAKLIRDEYGDATPFVLKDPRICRFIPLYEEVFKSLGIESRYVLIHRNPLSVAASLAQRDRLTPRFACLLWLRHVLSAEQYTRDRPRAIISYEIFLADWRTTIEGMQRTLGLALPRSLEVASSQVGGFLSADHQHHHATYADLEPADTIMRWAKRAYDSLLALTHARETESESSALMELVDLQAELEEATRSFGDAAMSELTVRDKYHATVLRRAKDEARERQARIDEQDNLLRLANDEARERQARIDELENQTTTLKETIAEQENLLRLANDEARERQARIDELEKQTTTLKESIAQRDTRIADLQSRSKTQTAEISLSRERLAALQRALVHQATRGARVARELSAIHRSSSWRILAPVRLMTSLAQDLLWHLGRDITPRPLTGLEAVRTKGRVNHYNMTDCDPQLLLTWGHSHRPLPTGLYKLTVELPLGERHLKTPTLYIDSGSGFSENERMVLALGAGKRSFQTRLLFPIEIHRLRFDPSLEEGKLALGRIRLRKLTRLERYGTLLVRSSLRYIRRPSLAAAHTALTLKVLAKGGPKGLAELLRAKEPELLSTPGSFLVGQDPRVRVQRSPSDSGIRRIEAGRLAGSEAAGKAMAKGSVLMVGHASRAPLAGAEHSFLDLARAAQESGYSVHAVVPHYNSSYFETLLRYAQTISWFEYPWWKAHRELDERAIRRFIRLMREFRVDIVHVNTIMLREPLEAARRLGVVSIVHVRELVDEDPFLAERIGMQPAGIKEEVKRRAQYIMANSDAILSAMRCDDRGFRVYNGIDIEELDIPNQIAESSISVGMISSNLPKKGLADFVRLADLAQHDLPFLRFVLVGPVTRHVMNLESLSGLEKLPPNLEVRGLAPNPRAALEGLNIVVNFSHFGESFGRTLAEAMAARRPVIAYAHGALPEVVRSGIDGFLLPYKRYEQALAPLRELCASPSRIITMGELARDRVKSDFSFARMSQAVAEAYDRILTVSRPKASDAAKPRIAYFQWHFPVPSETFVLNELQALVEEGLDVKVFCRHSPHPDLKLSFPISWQCVDSPEGLAEALRATRRTIVHSHFVYPTVTEFVWPACESASIPFTFIAHAQDIFRHESLHRNRIAELARSQYCHKIFVPGRFHHSFLLERGVPSDKMMINPQLSDSAQLAELPQAQQVGKRFDRYRICAVQRLVEKKGLRHLIEAAPRLEELGVSVSIFGYGPLQDELARQIRRIGTDNVHLCGAITDRSELVRVFAEHDLLVAPSVQAADGDMDGVPTVLMEAMGLGLPVLATRVASIPDLIRDGENGLLCAAGDSEEILAQVARFYRMPNSRTRAMIEEARRTVRSHYSRQRIVGNLLRQWNNDVVDIIVVAWRNLRELQEVIGRILKFTTSPFRIIVCNNDTAEDVSGFLDRLGDKHAQVTVIHKGYNAYVGPATNTALAAGSGKYAIYVCGKEGFPLRHGWECALIEYMDRHPEVGLGGTLAHSPSYLTGLGYQENHPAFSKFRNKEYAAENAARIFQHVQGGIFIIRREMYEEIGGFNEAVPHLHTDTEYSYYAESRGWRLASIPGLLSLYSKTRPGLLARIDENVLAVHPGSLKLADLLDQVAAGSNAFCNICNWRGDQFLGEEDCYVCPRCSSTPRQRTLLRFLAESTLTFRRLPGIYVNPHRSLEGFWQEQFGDRFMSLGELDVLDEAPEGAAELVVLDADMEEESERLIVRLTKARSLLTPQGVLVVFEPEPATEEGAVDIEGTLAQADLQLQRRVRYSCQVVRFHWRPLLDCRRANPEAPLSSN